MQFFTEFIWRPTVALNPFDLGSRMPWVAFFRNGKRERSMCNHNYLVLLVSHHSSFFIRTASISITNEKTRINYQEPLELTEIQE